MWSNFSVLQENLHFLHVCRVGFRPSQTERLSQHCLVLPHLPSICSPSECFQRISLWFLFFLFLFALLLQVCQLWTPSVPAEAGLGGVGGGPKGREAGQSLEGKDAVASQQQAALRLWQERRLGQQRRLRRRMLLTATAFLKVSKYCVLFMESNVCNNCWQQGGGSLFRLVASFLLLSLKF